MPDDKIEARARRAAEKIAKCTVICCDACTWEGCHDGPIDPSYAGYVERFSNIIVREMEGTTTFSTKARTRLERTLRDFKERLECIPEHYGRKRKENYKDWLKQEIKEIEGILKEGAP